MVEEVALPWQLADINRAARIHFGMIFGPSIQEIYEQHDDDLTSYAQRFYKERPEIRKEDFVARAWPWRRRSTRRWASCSRTTTR